MDENVIRINIQEITKELGLGKNPWYDYCRSDAEVFLQEISRILRGNVDACEVHVSGLIPPEISMSMGWMFGQAGLKTSFSRPTGYRMELPIPYGDYCEELGFA